MSQNKTTEEKLKDAVEASKLTLALNEQVTALALEKEGLIHRLAAVEHAIASPRAESLAQNDEVVALLKAQASAIAELQAKVVHSATLAAKADLKQYIERKNEEGEEGNTPAEKINNSGKGDDEACGPMKGKKGKKAEMPEFIKEKIEEKEEEEKTEAEDCEPMKKGKKASKAKASDDYSDFGDLSDEEVRMIKEYRQQEEGDTYAKSGKSKKADSDLSSPTVEDSKNFKKELPQDGLDPEKNNVNEDNTTSPKIAKKAKMKGETDVEEIIESTDMQNKEDNEGGEEAVHEDTLSTPEKGAKKSKAKAENSIGGVNKHEVVRTKQEVEEEGEGSFLNKKKDAKQANEVSHDAVIEEAVQKLAAIAQAKVKAEQENVSMRDMLALETKAKTEALASVEALHKKFEALMGKVNQIEASDRSLETKAAKIVSAQGVEPLASGPENEVKAKTDADFLAEFESISDKREQNKFFNANRIAIERAAFSNMKKRS
jgi:hypothetical protein